MAMNKVILIKRDIFFDGSGDNPFGGILYAPDSTALSLSVNPVIPMVILYLPISVLPYRPSADKVQEPVR